MTILSFCSSLVTEFDAFILCSDRFSFVEQHAIVLVWKVAPTSTAADVEVNGGLLFSFSKPPRPFEKEKLQRLLCSLLQLVNLLDFDTGDKFLRLSGFVLMP